MPLGTEVDLGPGHIVLDGAQLPRKGHSNPPLFGTCLLWPNGRPSQLLLSSCSCNCATVNKMSADIQRRAVPLRQMNVKVSGTSVVVRVPYACLFTDSVIPENTAVCAVDTQT